MDSPLKPESMKLDNGKEISGILKGIKGQYLIFKENKVLILGGGIVGSNAARLASGLGANVYILDINHDNLRYLDDTMPANVHTIYSNRHA